MKKVLKKAIMKRSQLRNVFLKEKKTLKSISPGIGKYCIRLLRREKGNYLENIDEVFSETVKPMFSNKSTNRGNK